MWLMDIGPEAWKCAEELQTVDQMFHGHCVLEEEGGIIGLLWNDCCFAIDGDASDVWSFPNKDGEQLDGYCE